jgi:hypothetical protein
MEKILCRCLLPTWIVGQEAVSCREIDVVGISFVSRTSIFFCGVDLG